jgi:hypothetical protein
MNLHYLYLLSLHLLFTKTSVALVESDAHLSTSTPETNPDDLSIIDTGDANISSRELQSGGYACAYFGEGRCARSRYCFWNRRRDRCEPSRYRSVAMQGMFFLSILIYTYVPHLCCTQICYIR